ncbi:MAG: bifunctional pyr operon transcriptional regulator/uracil phosphoribosyltransferase PyrR [Oscillospiraceae bacterium]|jgi:pyrimidine operon attenuation protein/uracil phosphoribosyltransferase|nr:bifunctional pyr operon transcriptional regulator/uracil phosphoribosyltransferase PyrR [Oscillospiraceae bacterium]
MPLAQLMDEAAVLRTLKRIAHEILESHPEPEHLALIGVHRRGAPLCALLGEAILRIAGLQPPVGSVDIRYYRDDLTQLDEAPRLDSVDIGFDVKGKRIVLVDDVIYTGRTARAAMDAVFAQGRPAAIRLAVLVDRGHRELPLRPDYVGKNIPTARGDRVAVRVPPYDDRICVELITP